MTALNSGMHFLSGIALYLGAPMSVRSVLQSHTAPKMRHRKHIRRRPHTPLTKEEKRELLESIRHDDWHE